MSHPVRTIATCPSTPRRSRTAPAPSTRSPRLSAPPKGAIRCARSRSSCPPTRPASWPDGRSAGAAGRRHRRPHPLPPRRAARVAVAARRGPQAGVDPGRRPRRQAGAARRPRPLRRRRRPPVDHRRPARPLPRAPPRRSRGAHRARPHRPRARAGPGRRRGRPARSRPGGTTRATSWPAPPSAARRRAAGPAVAVVVHLPERLRPLELDLLRAARRDQRRRARRRPHRRRRGRRRRRRPRPRAHRRGPSTAPARPPAPGLDRRGLDHRRRRRGAHRPCGRSSTAPAPARRSTAWRCCGPPTDRTPGSSSTTSTAADVPWNGRPGTGTGERMVPRVLAELLELDRRGLRRTDLMTLLGDVPARGADGRRVPTARWERIGAAPASCATTTGTRGCRRYIAEAGGRGSTRRRRRPRRCWPSSPICATASATRATTRPWAEWVELVPRAARALVRRGAARPPRRRRGTGVASRPSASSTASRHLDAIGPPVTAPSSGRRSSPSSTSRRPATARSATASTSARWPARAGLDVDLVVVLGAAGGPAPAAAADRPAARRRRARGRRAGAAPPSGPRSPTASSSPPSPPRPRSSSPCPRGDLRATAVAPPVALARRRCRGDGRRRADRRLPRPRAGRHGVPGLAGRAPPPRAVDPVPRRRRRPRPPARRHATPCCPRRAPARRPGRRRVHRVRRRPVARRVAAARRGRSSPDPHRGVAGLPARLLRALRPRRAPGRGARGHRGSVPRSTAARRCTPPSTACTRPSSTATLPARSRRAGPTCTSRCSPAFGAEVADELEAARPHRPGGVLGQRPAGAARASSTLVEADGELAAAGTVLLSEPRFGDGTSRVADRPARRPAGRVPGSIDRVDELPDGTPRRHRPQDRQRQELHRAHATIRRSGARASSSRCTPPPPGPCSTGPTPGAGRVHVLRQGDFQPHRRSRSTTTSGPRSARDLGRRRRRHRGRLVPGPPEPPGVAARSWLRVLRARRAGHGRAVGGVGAQAPRPPARPVVRRRRGADES